MKVRPVEHINQEQETNDFELHIISETEQDSKQIQDFLNVNDEPLIAMSFETVSYKYNLTKVKKV